MLSPSTFQNELVAIFVFIVGFLAVHLHNVLPVRLSILFLPINIYCSHSSAIFITQSALHVTQKRSRTRIGGGEVGEWYVQKQVSVAGKRPLYTRLTSVPSCRFAHHARCPRYWSLLRRS